MEEKDYTYTPTQWVDNSEPDIDAEHLNKIEAALTDHGLALNDLVDAVANKLVAKAQLVNNGLTTEEGFALDARYGKTLADGIAQLNREWILSNIKYITFSSSYSTGWLLRISIETNTGIYTIGFDKTGGVYAYEGDTLLWNIRPS